MSNPTSLFSRRLFLVRGAQLLSAAGSMAPVHLASRIGFDHNDPAFWERGCAAITRMVDEIERI